MLGRVSTTLGAVANTVTVIAGIIAFPFVLAVYEVRDAVTGAGAEGTRAEA